MHLEIFLKKKTNNKTLYNNKQNKLTISTLTFFRMGI